MALGFFSGSELAKSKAPDAVVPRCGACGLFNTCRSPKMPWSGGGRRGILVVGEAPGQEEDKRGTQFVGPSGDLLRHTLDDNGIDLDRDCWKTNALICRPPENKTPTNEQIGHCAPNTARAIRELQPHLIIPLGLPAVKAVLGRIIDTARDDMGRWVGWEIPTHTYNAWVCPTWHPAYILRTTGEARGRPDVAALWWRRHLATALGHTAAPYATVPDYAAGVERIYDHVEAARVIREIIRRGGLTSFDYETNCLKPETTGARIYTCAISWRGKRTIAYPWHGEAITATREYLRSPVPKVAANRKFEERWSRVHANTRVRNWVFDTMVNAHICDNREGGITGLKFQAFVRLGMPPYNEHIAQFLETTDERGLNQIDRIALPDLLLYNGIDPLLTIHVARHQGQELGIAI